MTEGSDGDHPFYGRARIYLAGILVIVASALALIDALSTEYTLDVVHLGMFLTTAALLLGVEGLKRIMGGP
jgi:hypothetical protein